MKLKLKITEYDPSSPRLDVDDDEEDSPLDYRFEEKEFESCEQAIDYINNLEAECTIVRAYEIGTGKRIVGGELVKINKQ